MTEAATQPKRRGRPPAAPGSTLTGLVKARVSAAQEAAWEAAGGAEWLRRQLDALMRKAARER